MASLRTSAAQTALRETRKAPYICPRCELRQRGYSPVNFAPRRQARYSSTEAATPPLLSKIRNDLKTAMKAKDTPRLNVLRAMISEYNNASKTATPIQTDLQLLALLKKKKMASENAAQEAKKANRQDLEDKQLQEIRVIEEYSAEVKLLSEGQIREAVAQTIDALKSSAAHMDLKAANVLKSLLQPGGALDGKPVDKSQVAKSVNELLGER